MSVLLLALVWPATAPSAADALTLATGGKTDYAIVVDPECSASERHAAEELARFLGEISGAEFPVRAETGSPPAKAILVGGGRSLDSLKLGVDLAGLGREGYVLRTVGDRLIIAGGKLRGTMYGCYGLLEDHLGCRWWDSKVSTIPHRDPLTIPRLDERVVPRLEYREPFWSDALDADWSARNRVNSANSRLDAERGGKIVYNGFVHTAYPLVPPQEFFATHPEYYSEINGKRTTDGAQLCLTNPDVVKIVAERVKKAFREHPEASIASVSQNDCGGNCQCAKCKAIDDREGSPAGSLIAFVNAVADEVAKEFPDKAIDTLAYQYTRKPPKSIRPRDNVIVRLCSIECCFSHPIESCPEDASFRDDIIGWSKLCKRLYVWDYVTDFPNYIMPFPNLHVLGPNVRFFADHSVVGIFEEGAYPPGGGAEFAELRAWVLGKVLWDPGRDADALIREFLDGYYGPAAGPVTEWIRLLHERAAQVHVNIWAGPGGPHLTDPLLAQGLRLFAEAVEKAGGDAALRARVEKARLPLQYASIARWHPAEPAAWGVGQFGANIAGSEGYHELVDSFVAVARREGIQEIQEGGGTFEPWAAAVQAAYKPAPVATVLAGGLRAYVLPDRDGRIARLTKLSDERELLGPPAAAQGGGIRGGLHLTLGVGSVGLPFKARGTGPGLALQATTPEGLVVDQQLVTGTDGLLSAEWTVANRGTEPRQIAPRLVCDTRPGLSTDPLAVTPRRGFRQCVPAGRDGAYYVVAPVRTLRPGETWRGVASVAPGEPPISGRAGPSILSYCDDWTFYRSPELSGTRVAPGATTGVAGYLEGNHTEWAIQWGPPTSAVVPGKTYIVRARMRVERTGDVGGAFTAGAYDTDDRVGRLQVGRSAAEVPAGEWFEVEWGRVTWDKGTYLWVAPTANPSNVQRVWVDWIRLDPAP